ncbi:uncharacterized protein B0P05DRAFT_568074 [Gilbertella persicaria]|uniref:uncharacterized protein n=1 Tax=Gilbertella persicaria TaxID=101096 RepID=UPI00221F1E54|nr:uncharacterized protein B0P05DRAFT_568074 [Gilbertella persicaria]KAI8094831.1 hypothetical protein B0P05DRAFT_568074 [Gilbertella persicaria]
MAAARALRKEQHFAEIVVFERNNHTGGTWKYSPETNAPPPIPSTNALVVDTTLNTRELYSPIYANLHTNLPHSVMCFHDVPFPKETPLYPTHQHVMDYLSSLAQKEDLLSLVRFSTLVTRVEYEHDQWQVTIKDLNHGSTTTETFDAVVVATGHYAVPFIPDLPGIQDTQLELIHSRDYRHPNAFKDKVVLVIGGGSSANDIVREISSVATKVYQSIRTQTELSRQAIELNPPHVHQVALVKQFCSDRQIELQDSQVLNDVDIVIFGTGYLYSFPFLPFAADELIKTGQKVHHVDHYMFYQKNPTLCFLGLPIRVVPLPLMQRQSTVMARYWSGKIPMMPHIVSKVSEAEDDRLDFVMGVAREFEYDDQLGAWAEGWIDDQEDWQSNHPITGRLTDEWKDLRKNALVLRKQYLGY